MLAGFFAFVLDFVHLLEAFKLNDILIDISRLLFFYLYEFVQRKESQQVFPQIFILVQNGLTRVQRVHIDLHRLKSGSNLELHLFGHGKFALESI